MRLPQDLIGAELVTGVEIGIAFMDSRTGVQNFWAEIQDLLPHLEVAFGVDAEWAQPEYIDNWGKILAAPNI